ncbi:hypothetical protein N9S62_03140 [Pelagibacteraceae bacterium]|nr:hypothetical protein [Pelagibacteraceae bacterium]
MLKNKMKIIFLVAGGRGGSDYFQGLLDNHSEIMQFPGFLYLEKSFFKIFNLESDKIKNIPKLFIKSHPHFFDSRILTKERHDKLGKNKNQFYTVDKIKFEKNFIKLTNKIKKIKKLDLFQCLYFSYYLSRGKNIKNKKIIFIHSHLVGYTKNIIQFFNFKKFSIIHAMKNPIEAINSPIKNWLQYEKGKHFFPINLYFHLDLVFNGIKNLLAINQKVFIAQLEKVKKDNKNVMRDFCKIYKIKYEKSMNKCTYFGLHWWGDAIGNRWIPKDVKENNSKINKKIFYERDIRYFEYLAEDIIKNYNYDFISSRKTRSFFNILPLKCEISVWKNCFKHKNIKHILSIPYFYLKRIFFLNKLFVRYRYLPKSLGRK